MDTSIILIIAVLGIYLVWKLMGTGSKKDIKKQRRFNIRKHRHKGIEEDDNE